MASTSHRFLLNLSILLGLIAIAANARPGRHFHPCKTLIFFSSSSSYSQFQNPNPNPNFSIQDPSLSSYGGPFITLFYTEVREIEPRTLYSSRDTIVFDRDAESEKPSLPFDLYSTVGSFHDRTKDVLSAVGALLFGMGCGALTAATMYLVWSLFAANRYELSDSEDEFDEEIDDLGLKKMGYVAVPPAKEVA